MSQRLLMYDKILLVTQDEIRNILVPTFQDEGYEIVFVNSLERGREILLKGRVFVVVLDEHRVSTKAAWEFVYEIVEHNAKSDTKVGLVFIVKDVPTYYQHIHIYKSWWFEWVFTPFDLVELVLRTKNICEKLAEI